MKPDYRGKIKTLEELAAAIGPRPRARTVIMCHGMFDIVHPGHLRHLMYAKEKADLLIASLTADVHATKADFRPYVPQDLRAANLAALEMVDFVIIDPHPTPIEHIKHLQPDFFAKGYEYFAEGVPPRTQEEIDTLESFGGEIVFTPGDVTFSTVLGNDAVKDFVLQDLEKAGIAVHAYVDRTRPTTQKERFIADGHKMLQVDRVDNRAISDRALRALGESLAASAPDVVIFSDFRHGIFNRKSIRILRERIPDGAIKVADSQVSNRWGNILEFTDFDLITPNEREARFSLGDQDSVVRPLALQLFRLARCKHLILKLGERGILGYRTPGHMPREFFTVDSVVDALVDPVGAGDALLAYSALGLARTGDIVLASILGSIAAAIACEYQGNRPVAPTEVEEKIARLEKRAHFG
jgi:cytidyltransferase-like protein